MGTGDLKFGINFMEPQVSMKQSQAVDNLSRQSILLYSFMPINVEIVPTDNVWTYRVYRLLITVLMYRTGQKNMPNLENTKSC